MLLFLTWAGLVCLFFNNNNKKLYVGQMLRPFHNKSEMNTRQAEGNIYTRTVEDGAQQTSQLLIICLTEL